MRVLHDCGGIVAVDRCGSFQARRRSCSDSVFSRSKGCSRWARLTPALVLCILVLFFRPRLLGGVRCNFHRRHRVQLPPVVIMMVSHQTLHTVQRTSTQAGRYLWII